MTWLALGYACIAYWHFRATLSALQPYDSAGTAALNAGLALTIGPALLLGALLLGKFHEMTES